ncbi:MAG TPA: hypothetical protein VJN96_18650 [Vicinamibacterales bacterium]|nr:hypothetical protein [Vicinamibacterales bacterium]
MAVLGLLSLLQITLLPGLALLGALRFDGPVLRRLLLSFGLSLTANYVAVFALTAAGLYVRPVVFAAFGAELVAIAWIYGAARRRGRTSEPGPAIIQPPAVRISAPASRLAATAALLLALFQIGQVLVTLVSNGGSIFVWVDAVLSWNRWAADWFHNRLPAWTYHYPQLLPANWSISYVFMNMPLQYIARGMMPLFLLALLLAMLDWGWTRKTAGPFIATLVAAYLYQHCRIDLTEGVADLPVSCMAFLSFWCLVAVEREPAARSRTRSLLIGAVLAAGAAVTKQPGLFFLPVFAAFAVVLGVIELSGAGRAKTARAAAGYVAIVLVVVVPYYVYAEAQIRAGLAHSEISYVTNGIFAGTPIPERVVNAGRLFLRSVGLAPTCLIVTLSLVALGDRLSRWMMGLIVVPWALLWAALASYDLRNLALAFPFLAMCAGTGAATLLRAVNVSPLTFGQMGARRILEGRVLAVAICVVGLIAVGLGVSVGPTSDQLIARHRRLERDLGNAALNAQLYSQYDKHPFSQLIVTNYAYLLRLPDLGDLGVFENFVDSPPESTEFAVYQKNLHDPKVGYFLLPTNAYPSIARDVDERLQRGDFVLLFRAEGYLFVEIVRR